MPQSPHAVTKDLRTHYQIICRENPRTQVLFVRQGSIKRSQKITWANVNERFSLCQSSCTSKTIPKHVLLEWTTDQTALFKTDGTASFLRTDAKRLMTEKYPSLLSQSAIQLVALGQAVYEDVIVRETTPFPHIHLYCERLQSLPMLFPYCIPLPNF